MNPLNDLIYMNVPDVHEMWLPDAIRYLLGLDDENWLSSGMYDGNRPIEFSPKRILIYLK